MVGPRRDLEPAAAEADNNAERQLVTRLFHDSTHLSHLSELAGLVAGGRGRDLSS